MVGRVKWFDNTKAYGFMEYKGHEDIFVHYSAIELNDNKTLIEGEFSNYELLETSKVLQNKNIFQVSEK